MGSHIFGGLLYLYLIFFFLPSRVAAQSKVSNTYDGLPVASSFSMKPHYFSFGLDASTIVHLKGGFSLGYLRALNQKRSEYLGLQFTGLPSHQKQPLNFTYHGSPVAHAQAETTLSIIIIQLSGTYFFHPDHPNSLFAGFQVGSTFVHNQIETSFDYFSSLPLWSGWIHNGDFEEQKSQTLFTSGISGGYWFNINGNGGICLKLGVNYTQMFKWIDASTALYNSDKLEYKTSSSSPIAVSFGVCILF